MKIFIRSLFIALFVMSISSSNATADLTVPFADFQGKIYLNDSWDIIDNTVIVESWVGSSGEEGDVSDLIVGQSVYGNIFTGFTFDEGTGQLLYSENAYDLHIGDYLSATIKDIEINALWSSNDQYSFVITAYLYDQQYDNDPYSEFIDQYMAASSTTNPQGQLVTWEYIVDVSGQSNQSISWDYLINVSGKVSPVVVPLPGAVWLLACGLGGLGLLKRKKGMLV